MLRLRSFIILCFVGCLMLVRTPMAKAQPEGEKYQQVVSLIEQIKTDMAGASDVTVKAQLQAIGFGLELWLSPEKITAPNENAISGKLLLQKLKLTTPGIKAIENFEMAVFGGSYRDVATAFESYYRTLFGFGPSDITLWTGWALDGERLPESPLSVTIASDMELVEEVFVEDPASFSGTAPLDTTQVVTGDGSAAFVFPMDGFVEDTVPQSGLSFLPGGFNISKLVPILVVVIAVLVGVGVFFSKKKKP